MFYYTIILSCRSNWNFHNQQLLQPNHYSIIQNNSEVYCDVNNYTQIKTEMTRKLSGPLNGKFFMGFLIAVGILLRFKHYLENRSLWLDEAWLSFGVSSLSFSEILRFVPFSNDLPLPPIGFSLTEKIFITLLENNEYTLRLFPFLCSIASLFLFYQFLKRFASRRCSSLAMAFFVLSEPLVYYSAEVKQYSSDVMIAMALLLIMDRLRGKQISLNQILTLGFLGVIALCFSHTATFILTASALVLIFSHLSNKSGAKARSIGCCCALWLLGFTALFSASLKPMINNPDLISGALSGGNYAPWPIFSEHGLHWLGWALLESIENPIGIWPLGLCLIFYILGQISFFKENKERSLLLNLPFIFALIGSIFHKYPFATRFVLFSLPVTFLFVSNGISLVLSYLKKRLPIVGIILVFFVFFNPLKISVTHFSHSREISDMRSTVAYFKKHYRAGDTFYVNNSGSYIYYYYQCSLRPYFQINQLGRFHDGIINVEKPYTELRYETHLFKDNGWLLSAQPADRSHIYHPITATQWPQHSRAKRTWILISHSEPELEPFILSALDHSGHRIDEYKAKGASLYLYDLSKH